MQSYTNTQKLANKPNDIYEKRMKKQKTTYLYLAVKLNPLFALCYFFCYLPAITKYCFFWIQFCYSNNLLLFITKAKISFTGALGELLVFMPANQMLAKGIQLEVTIQDGRVDIREVQQPQKVNILFSAKHLF